MSRITRHPKSTSRSNPMRWDCEKQGCFNKKKRPKIEVFSECFPRNIQMSDVDGEVEMSGHWLRLEWKEPGKDVPQGQMINYQRLTTATPTVVFVVQGNAETMVVETFDVIWQGKVKRNQGNCLDDLKERFYKWALWVENGPF